MRLVAILAGMIGLAAAAPASAAMFTFSASGGGQASAGMFTTTDTTTTVGGRNAYTITGISGSFNGAAITSLLPTGANFGGEPTDNYLFTDQGYFTLSGVGFSVANAPFDYNFYTSSGDNFTRLYTRAAGVAGDPGNDQLNTTPLAFTLDEIVPASRTFTFTASGGGQASAGTFTTTGGTTTVGGRQAYTITGISGSFNGAAITSLLPTGANFGGEPTDNYLFADQGYFTLSGVGFSVANAPFDYNFYTSSGDNFTRLYTRAAGVAGDPGNDQLNTTRLAFTLQPGPAVPEPAAWALLILGFGVTGAAVRGRRAAAAFA
jgi:hypothetical protein